MPLFQARPVPIGAKSGLDVRWTEDQRSIRQEFAGCGKKLPVCLPAGGMTQMLNEFSRFIDPLSMLIVFGGAAGVAALRATKGDVSRAFGAIVPLIASDPEADGYAAIAAVGKIEKIADGRGISCADRIKTAERFLRRAARRLSVAPTADAFSRWARSELAQREARHQGAIAYWRSVAETAPSMGMIGTVIGLIQMFARLDDVATIGPAMALAMLTTLYGIILATVVAGPIAARLDKLSRAEIAWQHEALERMLQIAEAELAPSQTRGKPALRTVS